MSRALALAAHGLFSTDPNPRVGCVLVRDGREVGSGWHRRAGEPHAERLAIAAAGEAARGATAYVTLEPCSHHGRTPPCSEALVAAGVSRLVSAMVDPNPLVAGSGLAQLRSAGIDTSAGLLESQARALNPGFVMRMTHARPYVRCKLAMSLDGRTAMASGESQWITSEPARRDVQRLRARSSAIVTGIGTVLADDPSLNVRLDMTELAGDGAAGAPRQPRRVVLDSQLRMPSTARMLSLSGETLIVTAPGADAGRRRALEAAGAEVLELAMATGGIDLAAVLEELARREANEVLLETGPTLAGQALAAGLVDELVLYQAPHLMGDSARGLVHLPGLQRMAQRLALQIHDVRRVGPDLRITAVPEPAQQ